MGSDSLIIENYWCILNDLAIEIAEEEEFFIDEINNGADDRI